MLFRFRNIYLMVMKVVLLELTLLDLKTIVAYLDINLGILIELLTSYLKNIIRLHKIY